MNDVTKPRLLGISGSLRKGSYNTAILRSLAEAVAERATLDVFTLDDVPLYDQDADNETPPAGVATLRAAIGAADGIVISAPEYNYGLSGVLKNALDWASRPYGKATLTGKPVLTMTASPAATGGARAQAQLNEVLIAIGAQLVLRPQAVIPAAHQKMTGDHFTDAGTLSFLSAGIDDLIRDIRVNASVIRQES